MSLTFLEVMQCLLIFFFAVLWCLEPSDNPLIISPLGQQLILSSVVLWSNKKHGFHQSACIFALGYFLEGVSEF